jgi:hypothetical protein
MTDTANAETAAPVDLAAAKPSTAGTARVTAPCHLSVTPPVMSNDKIQSTGKVKCSRTHRAKVEVSAQIFDGQSWQTLDDLFSETTLPAGKTRTFRTQNHNCKGLRPSRMRTRLLVTIGGKKYRKVSPEVEISCP